MFYMDYLFNCTALCEHFHVIALCKLNIIIIIIIYADTSRWWSHLADFDGLSNGTLTYVDHSIAVFHTDIVRRTR